EPAAARDRSEAERLVGVAGGQLVRGDVASAVASLQRARDADPTYAPIYRHLGLAYERMQRDAAARDAYRRYLQLAPNAPDAERVRARIAAL
ncbi:MAG: hypothetical protein KF729_22510, partial [Sandaracinaceae bacterium]|nr:hypothetical protein [Sandaracinaceae bacterium]